MDGRGGAQRMASGSGGAAPSPARAPPRGGWRSVLRARGPPKGRVGSGRPAAAQQGRCPAPLPPLLRERPPPLVLLFLLPQHRRAGPGAPRRRGRSSAGGSGETLLLLRFPGRLWRCAGAGRGGEGRAGGEAGGRVPAGGGRGGSRPAPPRSGCRPRVPREGGGPRSSALGALGGRRTARLAAAGAPFPPRCGRHRGGANFGRRSGRLPRGSADGPGRAGLDCAGLGEMEGLMPEYSPLVAARNRSLHFC